jgi:integrase
MSQIAHEESQILRSALSAPVAYFDYADALAIRQMVLACGDLDLPRYLLAPEVAVLLAYLPDLRQRLLIDTLWNTGARLNEALALTPAGFHLDGPKPFVVLKTLKQRERGKGRPRKDEPLKRIVPLLDAGYVQRLREYLASFKPLRHAPLWPVASNETPRNWIKAARLRAERDGVTFSLPVITPKTFRHSFAMHLIQCRVPLKVVQTYMGHKEASSTEVYTRVFALDVGHQYGVRFSMGVDVAKGLIGGSK